VLELGDSAGRRQLNEAWCRIRRGWYLGDDGFRGRMLKHVKQTLEKGRWGTYSGAAKREHGEAEAERLLARGMEELSVGWAALDRGAKGMAVKQALAWWISERTTVSRRWVSERLSMGDESRVTQAIRRMKAGDDGELRGLRTRLERAEDDHN
jgi:hypothetical protein